MKNFDLIPMARNTPSAIEKRYEYVRECIRNNGQNTIFLDEAGFNFHLQRHRGRNIIGRVRQFLYQHYVEGAYQ